MKILFPYVGDTYGGSHVSSLTLVKKLNEYKGIEVVVGLHERGYFSEVLEQQNIPWELLPSIELPQNGPLFRQLSQIYKCAKILTPYLKNNGIDIVHTNDRRMHLAWLFSAKRARVKHIWHQRTKMPNWRISSYALLSDSLVTISDYCRLSFPFYAKKNAIIIDNPVTLPEGLPNLSLDSHSNTFNILFVSNWSDRKRPLLFVEAAKLLLEHEFNNRKLVFTMVGEEREPFKTDVHRRIDELGIRSNMVLAGRQSNVWEWYRQADLLIAPAVNEGLGRTLIEATLMKVPVVASRDGGHCEILKEGQTGTFFEPDNLDDLVSKMINVLNDPEKAQVMADKSYKVCCERFSVDSHCDAILNVYKSLN